MRAFSLVELSIVLVILGLLTGGVLTGQSLIRASELRSVTTEFQRYQAAVNTFRDKYFLLPGDITNATRFWGDQATGTGSCADAAIPDGTPGTCNGDGDGTIDRTGPPVEMFRFWQHLALAGLIEGSYTGIVGSGDAEQHLPGQNVPSSKVSNAAWSAFWRVNLGSAPNMWTINYSNHFLIGMNDGVGFPDGAAFKPEEAWNIDTKLDDGKPGTGKVAGFFWTACTTATTETDYAATYKLTESAASCHLRFLDAF